MDALLTTIVASLLALAGLWLLNSIRSGLVSGKLPHSDSTSTLDRATSPLRYWSVLAIQLAFAMLFLGYAASALLRLLSVSPG